MSTNLRLCLLQKIWRINNKRRGESPLLFCLLVFIGKVSMRPPKKCNVIITIKKVV